ncbi:MAG: alpha/beta fold hydrolase [Bacillota bacterium]
MYCEIKEVKFYFEELGNGLPIIFLNGFTTDRTTLKKSFEPLMNNYPDFKRIYFDHPGVGDTVFPMDLDIIQFLNSLEGFIEKITGGKDFLVVGASFGGFIANYLLHNFCERIKGILYLYPLIKSKDKERSIEVDVLNKKNDIKPLPEIEAKVQNEVISAMDKTNFQFLNELVAQVDKLNLSMHIPLFSYPVSILTGRQDADVGYRDAFSLLKYFPKSTYIVLDNASHNLQIEQNQLFQVFVADWLERVKQVFTNDILS